MGKILNIQDFLAQKERQKRAETETVFVEGLGGEIEIKRLPLATFFDLTTSVDESSSGAELLRAQYDLIYAFCPILHSQELQNAYDCKVPSAVVQHVFQDNMDDSNTVTTAITAMYGNKSREQLEDELKN